MHGASTIVSAKMFYGRGDHGSESPEVYFMFMTDGSGEIES